MSWFQRLWAETTTIYLISESFFPKTGSCILGWPQTCSVTEEDLGYLILLTFIP